ncbi:MAG: Rne/Rng family ribonuclease [Desulfopila sp.]
MTEQTNDSQQNNNPSQKKERKKATIGAWWKSTVVDKITPPKKPISQSAEKAVAASTAVVQKSEEQQPPEKSDRPKMTPADETVMNTNTGTGEKADGLAEAKTDEPAPQNQESRQADTSADVATTDVATTDVATTGGSSESNAGSSDAAQSAVDKTTKPPQQRRGRGRRSQAAKKTQKQQTDNDAELQENQKAEKGPATQQHEHATDKTRRDTEQDIEQDTEQDAGPEAGAEPKPVTKLLINAEEPEECRLALVENGQLESIHVATSTHVQTKNNIYKARVVAIEPNLQAAFVEYGTEKNGFLPFGEIHPEYYKENVSDKVQRLIEQQQWKKLNITDVLERNRELLVQVVKEEVGKKGANMTTYLSLPGRCVVLMPGSDSKGISRKISGEERRNKLRDHILSLKIPEGIGWIVRTASVDITKAALGRDVNYLLRLWGDVKKKGQDIEGVGLIYQDHDHVLRFLRENFDPDLQEIQVDEKDAFEQVKGFIEMLPTKQRNVRCKLHKGARPIFNQYSIEDQIESIYQPKVNLPSGGSIVIDPTEALVAIDVNSGSTSKGHNFEETIFQANMEAAKELARQLRLRDLGGLVVVDFIDMRSKKNIREVERQVKTAMKRDKAKVDISRISKFGLMQISRQKLGAPIEMGNYRICSNCRGRGVVRSVETLALFYLRRIHTAASRTMVRQIECRFPLDVAGYLLNNKRQEIRDLENKYNTEVVIIADPQYKPADNDIISHKLEKDEAEQKRG